MPSEDYDYSEYYEHLLDNELYNDAETSKTFQKINTILQFLTIFINLFHLFILSQKQMRSTAVNILMIGICTSDILFTLQSAHQAAFEMNWIPTFYSFFPSPQFTLESCVSMEYTEQKLPYIFQFLVNEICRLTSIYLSVLMAVYRTLSVMFPMSIWVQKMSNSKSSVITIIVTVALWFGYTTSHFVNLKLVKVTEYVYFCLNPINITNSTTILVLPATTKPLADYPLLNGLTKAIPAVLYPIITIFLIIELRKIRIRRKKLQGQTSDNTTKLVFFMTLSFMFSEGLAGSLNLLSDAFQDYKDPKVEVILFYINIFNHPVTILKTVNAMSHCFICILMSSQYRDTVVGFFKKGKRIEVILVQEATSSGGILKNNKRSY